MKVYMVTNPQREDRQRLRLARTAVGIFFFLNGVITATLSTRLPEVQMKLALSPGQLGLALLGCTIGGLLAMNAAARLSTRFGSNIICTIAAFGMCLALPLIALAPILPYLILALVLLGAGHGAMDVTMNMQGTNVERGYGRSIMNSFHACFSIGSLIGAGLGSVLAAFRVSPELHFSVITILACAGLVWSSRHLLQERPVQNTQPVQKSLSLHFSPTLLSLGVIAFCSLLSVGALFDWSAVYLSGTLHTGAGLAAVGFATFLACMALGRSSGDFLVTRYGPAILVRCACLLAATGLALALLFTWVPMVFFGLSLVGVGLSVPLPLVLSATGRLSRQGTDSALAMVTTWGYVGMIAGPSVIGFVADRVGLRLALALVVCLCLLAALLAPAVSTAEGKENGEITQKKEVSHP
jgi:MFS family permease